MPSQGSTPIRIMLAHHHPVVRLGARAVLAAEPGYLIVGETGDGSEVISLARRLRPDVLVLDLDMPGLGGIDMIHRLHQCTAGTRVVVLATRVDQTYAAKVVQHGAAAFVARAVSAAALVDTLRQTVAGRCSVIPSLRIAFAKLHAGVVGTYDSLTPREREILQLSADGHTAASIATLLLVSRRTVEKHRENLAAKLDLHTQTELVRYALQQGIVSKPSLHTGTHG